MIGMAKLVVELEVLDQGGTKVFCPLRKNKKDTL